MPTTIDKIVDGFPSPTIPPIIGTPTYNTITEVNLKLNSNSAYVQSKLGEGVAQGDPLSLVLYGITLVPLAEEMRAVDPGLLSSFHADDASFDSSARQSAHILKLLMKRGPDKGYFPEPYKSLFIPDTPGQEEAAKREFVKEGLVLNFTRCSRYLGAYLGPQKEL